mmetsp:Transcript_1353/g.2681  ORF Transcript_1353/g.2681 Transcript_1353/m.2681 type:complete len:372 (-) Transcript_1353:2574-3689(-)
MPAGANEGIDDVHQRVLQPFRQTCEPVVQNGGADGRDDRFKVGDDARTEDRADQRPCPTEDGHQYDLTRGGPEHPLGPCQRVHRDHQATSQASIHARDDEGSQCIGARIEARVAHPRLVRLDRPQHQAEGRAEQPHREVEGHQHDEAAEVVADVEGEVPPGESQLEARSHLQSEEVRRGDVAVCGLRRANHARIVERERQPGLAARHRGQHRIGQRIAHLRKGQRQDREVDPRAPQRNEADQQREQPRHDHRDDQRRDDVHRQQFHHPDPGVGADPQKRRMTEGEVAREPEEDVVADREDAEDHQFLHQVRIARVELRHANVVRERVQDEGRENYQCHYDQEEPSVFAVKSEHCSILHHALAAKQATGTGQ